MQTARWLLRPLEFLDDCRRRHGDAFSLTFLGFQTPMVMISDPEAVRALYSERRHGLPPGRSVALMPIMGPRSVLLLEGSEHLARRKLMLPPFHGERMRAYEPLVRELIEAEIDSWPRGTGFPVHPRMQALTLEVILRAVFGVTDEDRLERLREQLTGLLADTSSPRLQFGVLLARRFRRPGPLAELARLMRSVDELILAEISERRADPRAGERDDILAMLVQARFDDGSAMGDREIRDQLVTLLLAGHETTATALAWTLDLLLRNRPALERLKAEVAEDGEDYLRAVIAESLRLRPVVPLAGRRLVEELEVDGYTLPPGTDVTPAIWLTHTRADVYRDPYEFKPERFLDAKPETYSWIPFGGGVRRCLGAAFAEFEMRVVLSAIMRRADLRAASSKPERIARRNITFSPRSGTSIVVERVRPAPEPDERGSSRFSDRTPSGAR